MPVLYQYLTHSLCTGYCLLHGHPWTWKDGLYKVRDNLTLTTRVKYHNWRMRNNHFMLELVICCYLPSSRALVTYSPFQARSNFTMYFCANLHWTSTVQGQFTAAVGHALSSTREGRLIVPPPKTTCPISSVLWNPLIFTSWKPTCMNRWAYSSSHVTTLSELDTLLL